MRDSKAGTSLVMAFQYIFKLKLQTDEGTEFKNLRIYTISSHIKRPSVKYKTEKFNRTLKQLMWLMFTASSYLYRYLDRWTTWSTEITITAHNV